jgi:hypothetical protein
MGTLTKSERDGLEDVFLSIHSNNLKYNKIKEITSLTISKDISFFMSNLLKRANLGLKTGKFSNFITIFAKKKKNLSK